MKEMKESPMKLNLRGIPRKPNTLRKPLALAASLALFGSVLFAASAIFASQASAQITFNTPSNLTMPAGGTGYIIDASGYATDGTNTFTCGAPSAVDSRLTVTQSATNSCSFSVAASATAATGNASFTTLLTSSGGTSLSATLTIAITAASSITFTAPASIPLGAGNYKTVDFGSYATDGDYTITCSFNANPANRHALLASVTATGCSFRVWAGSSQGSATVRVMYHSSGGTELTRDIPFTIGAPSVLIYQRVSNLQVRTGGSIQIDAGSYASDQGGWTVSCGDATAVDSKITVTSRNGCVYNITAGNTAGSASFTVPYTSAGGNARTGRVDIAVVTSNIVFVDPGLSVGRFGNIVIDASDYASDGSSTISCGTITQSHALIASIDDSGCSIRLTAGGTAGTATFTVPYSSTGGDTHNGQISLVIGSIPALSSSGCSGGAFVNTTTYPRVSGSSNDLVEDCLALVGIQNHWAAVAGNNDLAAGSPMRLWGTGSSSQRMIQNWAGVTVSGNRVTGLDLAASVSTDNIAGTIPSQFGNLRALTSLDLSGNSLTGAIPSGITSLTSLTSLDLSDNSLTGTIPAGAAGIGRLTALTSLDLSRNQLTGTIPTGTGGIDRLTALTSLDLSSNQLTGAIPTQLGNLASLTSLYLSSNQLTGSIPATFGSLTALVDLFVGGNHLSGTIPSQLGTITTLNLLDLCRNYLSGEVPAALRSGVNLLGYNTANGYSPVDCQIASDIQYTAPTGLGISAGSALVIDAARYVDDGAYAITCGDASSVSASLASVVRAPNTCRFTVTAGSTAGTGSFTVRYDSAGGDTHSATITLSISNISFTAPIGLIVAAGEAITIDASSYASESGETISCADATNIDSKFSSVTRSPNSCSYRATAKITSEGSASFTVPYSSSSGASLNAVITVSITPAPTRPESPPEEQGAQGQPQPVQPIPATAGPDTTDTTPEQTDIASGWNTFTIQSGGTTTAAIRRQLNLPANQDFYTWDAETQAWTRITNPAQTIPAGATISFRSRALATEELETTNLGHNTQEASLTQGWNIANTAAAIERDSDSDFLVDDALIDCDRLTGVIAVVSYSSRTRRWSLYLPCHPRSEARLTTGEDAPYDRMTTIGEGDSIYIYTRSRIPLEITWNAETQTYQPS